MNDPGLLAASLGETITRATIWLSVLFWAAGIGMACRRPGWGRGLLTAAFLAYAFHIVAAFDAFYGWSHATAIQETARQTEELTGWNSGAGLWLNYLFGFVWVADLAFWWSAGHTRYGKRSGWIGGLIHGFLAFLIFNGTVVFGDGPVRWFGVAVFTGLALTFLLRRPTKSNP